MRRAAFAVIPLAVLAAVGAGAVLAQSGAGFSLTWHAITGGGGSSSGSGYTIAGAIGQPFASSSSGSGYVIDSGFFAGGAQRYRVFLPILAKDED